MLRLYSSVDCEEMRTAGEGAVETASSNKEMMNQKVHTEMKIPTASEDVPLVRSRGGQKHQSHQYSSAALSAS